MRPFSWSEVISSLLLMALVGVLLLGIVSIWFYLIVWSLGGLG